VAAALTDAFHGAIAIDSATGPELSQDVAALTLTGTTAQPTVTAPSAVAPLLGATAAPCTFTATVEDNRTLRGQLAVTVPAGWTWGAGFDVLAGDIPAGLTFAAAGFTSSTRSDAPVGLQFEGRTEVPTQLGQAVDGASATSRPATVTVTLRGAVAVDADGRPRFTLTSTAPLDRLTITRVDQDPLILTNSVVTLRTAPPDADRGAGPDAPNVSAFVARGTLAGLAAATPEAEVDLPGTWAGSLTVRVGSDAAFPAFATIGDALAVAGTPTPVLTALRTLPALAGPTIAALSVTFDPNGVEGTRTELSVTVASTPWRLLDRPELSVSNLTLTLAVTRRPRPAEAPGGLTTTFAAGVSGTITLAGAPYTVRVDFAARGPATVVVTNDDRVPTLATVAACAGFSGDEVLAALPAPLVALGSISVDMVAVDIDLAAMAVTGALLRFAQTRPWPIGGVLTLSDWVATVSMQRGVDGWSPRGDITGSITLGSDPRTVRFDVELGVPVDAETGLWTLGLAEDEVIHVPTIGDLLAPLAGTAAVLPTGIATLGGLDITRFQVGYDALAGRVAMLAFASRQSTTWTIIPDALAVSDLDLTFALRPGEGSAPGQVMGSLFGIVTIGGQPLDVVMIKNGFDDDWRLEIGFTEPAVFPGFANLDAWLAPSAVGGYLPSNLPLAHGFELWNVLLRFDGASGSLAEVAFVLVIPDLWTVVPDRLAITDVRAEIDSPYPIVATAITGTIAGTVTLGDADILVSAAKPTGADPWAFAGSLAEAVRIDLVAVANGLSTQVFALPADIGSFGLFPDQVTIESANVRAVPDTGLFHFDGLASFEWQPTIGGATLTIERIGGTVDIARTGDPTVVTLVGALSYASLRATVGLRVGTATTPTIITGTITSADAARIALPELADGIGATTTENRWAAVLPADFTTPTFDSAALWVNLTGHEFVLHGRLAGLGDGVLLCARAGPSDPAQPTQPAGWSYALAVSLGAGFLFGSLFTALRIDDYVKVRHARLIVADLADSTLGTFAGRVGAALAAAAPGTPSPIADLTGSATPLPVGALFTAELDVRTGGPGTLLGTILTIGGGGADPASPASPPPSIRLTAAVDRADSTRTLFTAELADITLFAGLVTITHPAALPTIRLTYRPAAAGEFTLDARLALNVFGSSYGFDVHLRVNDDQLVTTAEIPPPTSQSVVPFSLPGIQIDELALAARIDFAKPAVPASGTTPAVPARARSTRFWLSGHTRLGPAPATGRPDTRLSFAARLALVDATPVLAHVAVDQDFSIASFLADCVTGDGASWGSFVDLILRPGSRIYYYRAGADPAGALARLDDRDLLDGYHLDAEVTMRLVVEVTVRAMITVRTDATGSPVGVTAAIALVTPIDMVFAQLAGTTQTGGTGPYTGGPEVRFTTGADASFGIATGVNFLGEPFGSVAVAVSTDSGGARRFAGRLEAGRELAPFGRLACEFVYLARDGGPDSFTIVGWPAFTWVRDLIDVVSAIREAFDAVRIDGCGALVGFVVRRAFTSSWSMAPGVRSDGDNLVFSLAGSYALTLVGQDSPFVTVAFPAFEVRIPSSTRFADLPEALAAGVARASGDLVRQLLSSPDKIAAFAGIVFGEQAAAYAATLLCRGLVDAAVTAAADAAATAMAGAATVAAGTAAAVIAGAGGGGDGGGDGGGGGSTTTPAPAVPAITRFGYAGGVFTLDWSSASYAGGYGAELRAPDGSVLSAVTLGLADRPLRLTHAAAAATLPAGVFVGRARAVRGEQQSAWASATLTKPASPPATLTYRSGSLVATWPAEPGGAYEAAFTDPAMAPITTVPDVRAGTASIPLDDPRDGVYTARVRTLGGDIPADWGAGGSTTPLTMPAPTGLVVRAAGDALTVTFPAVGGAGEHLVEVSTVAGTTVTPVTTVVGPSGTPNTPLSVTLPAPAGRPYTVGATYGVRVRARRPDAVGAWSARATIVYDTRPGWSFSLRNDLVAAATPAGPDDGVLRVQVTDPAGIAPVDVPPGTTVALGAGPVAGFEIVRSVPRVAGIRDATRYTVTATTRGGALTLDFTGVRAAADGLGGTASATADIAVRRAAGFAFGATTLWADAVPVERMVFRVFDVLADPARVNDALRTAYPGLTPLSVAGPLVAAVRDPLTLAPGIIVPAPPVLTAAGTVLLPLSNAFESAAAPLGLSAAVLVAGAGLGLRPNLAPGQLVPLAQAAFTLPAGTTDSEHAIAVARAFAAAGLSSTLTAQTLAQLPAMSPLTPVARATMIATALRTAFEDTPDIRAAGYAVGLAGATPTHPPAPGIPTLGVAPPVAALRLRAVEPAASPAVVADALTSAYTGRPTSAFLLTWALLDTGLPAEDIASRVRRALPGAPAVQIAGALAAAQDPAATAARSALSTERCSPPEAVRRRRAALTGLHPLRAAFAIARSDGMGLARPAVLAASLLVAGYLAPDVRATAVSCFPQLVDQATLTTIMTEATAIWELYR
jgi:hypothetical protein